MTQIDMDLFFKRGVRLIGSTLRSRSSEEKARILGELERTLWPEFSAGRVKSILHKVLPISQVEEAHRILRDGENIGKVVLTVERGPVSFRSDSHCCGGRVGVGG